MQLPNSGFSIGRFFCRLAVFAAVGLLAGCGVSYRTEDLRLVNDLPRGAISEEGELLRAVAQPIGGVGTKSWSFSLLGFERFSHATIVWDFGDGVTEYGPTAEHIYEYEGTYLAVVRVLGANGGILHEMGEKVVVGDGMLPESGLTDEGFAVTNPPPTPGADVYEKLYGHPGSGDSESFPLVDPTKSQEESDGIGEDHEGAEGESEFPFDIEDLYDFAPDKLESTVDDEESELDEGDDPLEIDGPIPTSITEDPIAMVSDPAALFNVLDFGAVGDGVTDDASAIQAAIDAADDAGGGVVFFPQGRYNVVHTPYFALDMDETRSVHLSGVGPESVITSTLPLGIVTAYALRLRGVRDVVIEDLRFETECTGTTPNSFTVGLIAINTTSSLVGSEDVIIRRCEFHIDGYWSHSGQKYYNIYSSVDNDLPVTDVRFNKRIEVVDNLFDHSKGRLVQMKLTQFGRAARNTVIEPIGAHCFRFLGAADIAVYDNVIIRDGTDTGVNGFYLAGQSNGFVPELELLVSERIHIYRNSMFANGGGIGLMIEGAKDCTFEENVILGDDNLDDGIRLLDTNQGGGIRDIRILNNDIRGIHKVVIRVGGIDDAHPGTGVPPANTLIQGNVLGHYQHSRFISDDGIGTQIIDNCFLDALGECQ
jgi:hypothetical protein